MSLGWTASPDAVKGLYYGESLTIDVESMKDSMDHVFDAQEAESFVPVGAALTGVVTAIASGVFDARSFPQEEDMGVKLQEVTNAMLTVHLAMVTESMRLARRIDLGFASILGDRPTGVKAKRVAKESTGVYLAAYRDRCQLFGVDSMNSGVPTETEGLRTILNNQTGWWEQRPPTYWEAVGSHTAAIGSIVTTIPPPDANIGPQQLLLAAPAIVLYKLLPPVGQAVYWSWARLLTGRFASARALAHMSAATSNMQQIEEIRVTAEREQPLRSRDSLLWLMQLTTLVALEYSAFLALLDMEGGWLQHQEGYARPAECGLATDWPALSALVDARMATVLNMAPANTFEPRIGFGEQMPGATDLLSDPIDVGVDSVPVQEVTDAPSASGTAQEYGTGPVVHSPRVTASDGMRFLSDQFRCKTSVYQWPEQGSAQRKWDSWFKAYTDFQTLFPVHDHIIVGNLTGRVSDDDPRLYGWVDRREELQGSWTLQDFLNHVKSIVLNIRTTKSAAWTEFQALVASYASLRDCIELSTKIQNLYRLMYAQGSTEIEPVSRAVFTRTLHGFMSSLHNRASLQSAVGLAWRNWDLYNATADFEKYVAQHLHSPESTQTLSDAFVAHTVDQLYRAHQMHTQMLTIAQVGSRTPAPRRDTTTVLTNNTGAGTGRESRQPRIPRDRSRSETRSGRGGRGNGTPTGRDSSRGTQGSDRPGSGAGRRSSAEPADRPAPRTAGPKATLGKALEAYRKHAPDQAPPYLRQVLRLGGNWSTHECIRRVRDDRACLLCQEAHGMRACPYRRAPAATEWARKFFEFRDQMPPPDDN